MVQVRRRASAANIPTQRVIGSQMRVLELWLCPAKLLAAGTQCTVTPKCASAPQSTPVQPPGGDCGSRPDRRTQARSAPSCLAYSQPVGDSQPPTGANSSNRPPTGIGTANRPPVGTGTANRPPTGTGTANRPPVGTGTANRPPVGTGTANRPPVGTGTANRQPSLTETASRRPSEAAGLPVWQVGELVPVVRVVRVLRRASAADVQRAASSVTSARQVCLSSVVAVRLAAHRRRGAPRGACGGVLPGRLVA